MNTKRIFIAFDLSIAVVEQLVLLQETLQADLVASQKASEVIRWVDAPNIHLTMKFLGATESAFISNIDAVMSKLACSLFPFEVKCQQLGCFPSPQHPRVLWAGLDAKSAEVTSLLQRAIENDLAEIGCPTETREFHPHITLGRIKSNKRIDFQPLIEKYASARFGKCMVKDLVLYESVLRPQGPEYLVLNRYPLGHA